MHQPRYKIFLLLCIGVMYPVTRHNHLRQQQSKLIFVQERHALSSFGVFEMLKVLQFFIVVINMVTPMLRHIATK